MGKVVRARGMHLLVVALVVFTVITPEAWAYNRDENGIKPAIGPDGNAWYYYFAVQDSRDYSGNEWYGWEGMKGYLYWKSDGTLPSNIYAHNLGALSVKMADLLSWSQGGLWLRPYSTPCQYHENVYKNRQVLSWGSYPSTPGPCYVRVMYEGHDGPGGLPSWEIMVGGWHESFEQDYNRGKATAQDECYVPAATYPRPATIIFGSDTYGYDDSAHALWLQNYVNDTWEVWDTSLSHGTTWAHEYSPQIIYSTSMPYYYFSGWQ